MTREEAIRKINYGLEMETTPGPIQLTIVSTKALRIALATLQTLQKAENPTPLTLDELRKMDGQPVWVEHGNGGEWVTVHWDYAGNIATAYKACLREHEYGEYWTAYHHKPKDKK